MANPDDLRYTKIALKNGSGAMPALGFGTLIPDPVATRNATKAALEAGFRLLDTAERYRTEKEVGEAMQEVFQAGQDQAGGRVCHHEALEHPSSSGTRQTCFRGQSQETRARLRRSLSHPHPLCVPTRRRARSAGMPSGNVIYDQGVTLLDTWRALESLVDEGRCRAIGLSDVSLEQVQDIFEAARIKPAVVHVESHPYLPQWDLLNYCKGAWHRAASVRSPGP